MIDLDEFEGQIRGAYNLSHVRADDVISLITELRHLRVIASGNQGAIVNSIIERTRHEVPEPSTLPDYFAPKPMPQVTFADRLSARSDYELGRMAGRDEIRAELEERKKNGVWVEHAGHCCLGCPMTLPTLWRCPSCPVILVGPQIDGAREHTLEHESENP